MSLVVTQNCSGDHQSPNYSELVNELLEAYEEFGCNMYLKLHLLHLHLSFYPQNLGEVSDDHEEQFQHDISVTENGIRTDGTQISLQIFAGHLT
jgi:hypothetical protein